MRALDFPRLKPFTAGFFTPLDTAEQKDVISALVPFTDCIKSIPITRQLIRHEVPCGHGWNHDKAAAMYKRELIERLCFKSLYSVSSEFHLKGLPTGAFALGGVLPVGAFYQRRILPMPTWLDEPYEKRMLVGRTYVAGAVQDAVRDMIIASNIRQEDFDKIAIVIGTDPMSARYFNETEAGHPRLFSESPLKDIALEFVTSLSLQVRHRFLVTLSLKSPVAYGQVASFGALVHQPDDVTNEKINDEPTLVYHCRYKFAPVVPVLIDIRMDLGI